MTALESQHSLLEKASFKLPTLAGGQGFFFFFPLKLLFFYSNGESKFNF